MEKRFDLIKRTKIFNPIRCIGNEYQKSMKKEVETQLTVTGYLFDDIFCTLRITGVAIRDDKHNVVGFEIKSAKVETAD